MSPLFSRLAVGDRGLGWRRLLMGRPSRMSRVALILMRCLLCCLRLVVSGRMIGLMEIVGRGRVGLK